ncbi:MAG: nuclear transport factor 2 family protein [Nitrospiraceae bacterium]
MNRHIGTMASLLALILMQGCTEKDDTSTSQEHTKGDMITEEEALIVTTLNEVANAESQFFSTKDSESILRFYAQDYMGIKDGKSETVKDHKKYLAEILEQIRLGKPIGISSKLMNIRPSVEGRFGWATYEYEYKVGGGGGKSAVPQEISQGQCTTIFRKQADSWLIRHKHCSSARPTLF